MSLDCLMFKLLMPLTVLQIFQQPSDQTSPDEVEPGKLGESNLFVFLRSQVAVCLRLRITEVREFCNLFFTLAEFEALRLFEPS